MMNAEERRNQLEELLARVRRNRRYMEVEREGEVMAEESLSPPDLALKLGGLPTPLEPRPVARPLSQPPSFKAVDEERAGDHDHVVLPKEEEALGEVRPLLEVAVLASPLSGPAPASASGDASERLEEPVSEAYEPVVAALDVAEVIAESIPEVVEMTIPAPVDTFAKSDRETEWIATPKVGLPQPLPVRTFEAPLQASAEVVAVHGEVGNEWSLSAVLTRAWRVGSPQ